MIFSYLLAIVAANLAVTHFGQVALLFTAWILIPFDLVARDVLHDRWSKEGTGRLFAKMLILVGAGSLISYSLNMNAGKVATASFFAFFFAGVADCLIYHWMRKRHRLAKMNASNAVSALVDSIVFPAIAFGVFNAPLVAGQTVSKFVGGLFWSLIFVYWMEKKNRESC